ncbi:MAG: MFS transporter [Sneathiella sp.]|nr:MFS transporter [Sneathiella sp.]
MVLVSNEKRNVLVLAGAQALFQTVTVMTMTIAGLVGLTLAPDKSLATLPIAMMMVSVAAIMIPASLIMQNFGRKTGFFIGSTLGCVAGLTAAGAIWINSFWLFVFATMLIGGYQAFAQYYRFAAAEAASSNFRSRAISWVVAGGVVAAIAGPNIARFTQDLGQAPYMISFLAMSVLSVAAFILLTRLGLPSDVTSSSTAEAENVEVARPLWKIMKQGVFLTAVVGSSVGFAMMIMVMTATPLAMRSLDYATGDYTTVIQWHVLGMFLPSFVTGGLIARFGVLPIMTAGIAFFGGHVFIVMNGDSFMHFLSGLAFVGLGWNFLFIGGTTLLTEAYRPSERAKTQAAHDFLMFASVSLGSLSAGGLLDLWGWNAINLAVIPFLLIAIVTVFTLALLRRRTRQPAGV